MDNTNEATTGGIMNSPAMQNFYEIIKRNLDRQEMAKMEMAGMGGEIGRAHV